MSVGPLNCSHPKILSSGISDSQLQKFPIVSKSQPNIHSIKKVVDVTSYVLRSRWYCKMCDDVIFFFFLPGQAPSLMTILSTAVSHEEENPRLASNTILKIKWQQTHLGLGLDFVPFGDSKPWFIIQKNHGAWLNFTEISSGIAYCYVVVTGHLSWQWPVQQIRGDKMYCERPAITVKEP